MSRGWRGRPLSPGTILTQTPCDLDLSKKGLGSLCLRGNLAWLSLSLYFLEQNFPPMLSTQLSEKLGHL